MFGIVIIALSAWWLADELVTAPLYLTDEQGHFAGWQKSQYKSLFDYLKKKIFKK